MSKPLYILGLSCYYHDSSATLIKDGEVVVAAQEERFTREKHDTSFPIKSIIYCLESENITIQDIHRIAFYEKPLLKLERLLYQHIAVFPLSLKTFITGMPSWAKEKMRLIKTIRKQLKYGGPVFFIPHHLAHAASSFLVSPFEKAAIVTVDGVGEWTTTAIGEGRGNDIKLTKELHFPHSLGLLYSTITAYLGFSVNNSEYKVMGLSAYGTMDRDKNPYYAKLKRVIDIQDDGSYELDMSYFIFHWADRMPARKLKDLLGGPTRTEDEEVTERHKDIAAALQMILEDVMTKMLNYAHKITGMENVVLSGGVALNSAYNGKILKNTPFKNLWIQPDAGDGGTSLGAAAFVYNTLLGHKRNYVEKSAYLGPEFSNREIETFLKSKGIKYTTFKDVDEVARETAKLVFNSKVVGWFQGRMEWGPRALGARSILANPADKDMQSILNLKVKHREEFRPFAPAVLKEKASEYFDCDEPLPDAADFMLMVYPTKLKWRKVIPSVVHVDGSGRIQTVSKTTNPLYYKMIESFGELSGIPIVVNTSFNIRGEPIVCTPQDAYNCMMGTEIDCLVMGHFLIQRADNIKDIIVRNEKVTD